MLHIFFPRSKESNTNLFYLYLYSCKKLSAKPGSFGVIHALQLGEGGGW